MKRTLQGLLVLTLAVVLAMPAMAAEEKKKKKKKGRKAPAAVKVPKSIVLTAEQKTKVAAINKEFAPKLIEVNKKAGTIITAEQRKARNAASQEGQGRWRQGKGSSRCDQCRCEDHSRAEEGAGRVEQGTPGRYQGCPGQVR